MQQQSQWGSGHITTLSINDAHMGPQVTGNYQPLACVGRGTYAGLYGNTQNPTGRGSGEARVPNPHQACQVFLEARIFRSQVSLPGAMRGGGPPAHPWTYGTVWKALHKPTGEIRAIKKLVGGLAILSGLGLCFVLRVEWSEWSPYFSFVRFDAFSQNILNSGHLCCT